MSSDQQSHVPLQWDWKTRKAVAWSQSLSRPGHSTPVIGQGKVWVTSATEDGTEQYVAAYAESSGDVLHQRLLFTNESPEPLGNAVNNYAAPSPVLEKDAIYVHFGTYGTAKLNAATAETIWQRRDINARHFRGPGSSPVLFDNLLILTFDGIDRQFVIALDKDTGDTVWRTPRSTDYGDLDASGQPLRDGDMRKAYGTPAIARVGEGHQLVSVGSRAAFGYDARTGKELWTLPHQDYNAAAQPIVFEDTVIIHTGSGGEGLIAIRLDQEMRGDITDTHVVWRHDRGNSRLSYPVLCQDLIVWVTDRGVASAVDARTGEVAFTERLGGNYIASPLVVDDHVLFFSSDGEAIVTRVSGSDLKEIRRNSIPEDMTASPAVSHGGLVLRTRNHLVKLAGVGSPDESVSP